MPSTSTFVWFELVPRMKTELAPRGPPVWTMFSPGTSRRMSGTVRCCLLSMSLLVITVTLLAISVAGAATRVATTTT
jgi:hypothetical protein